MADEFFATYFPDSPFSWKNFKEFSARTAEFKAMNEENTYYASVWSALEDPDEYFNEITQATSRSEADAVVSRYIHANAVDATPGLPAYYLSGPKIIYQIWSVMKDLATGQDMKTLMDSYANYCTSNDECELDHLKLYQKSTIAFRDKVKPILGALKGVSVVTEKATAHYDIGGDVARKLTTVLLQIINQRNTQLKVQKELTDSKGPDHMEDVLKWLKRDGIVEPVGLLKRNKSGYLLISTALKGYDNKLEVPGAGLELFKHKIIKNLSYHVKSELVQRVLISAELDKHLTKELKTREQVAEFFSMLSNENLAKVDELIEGLGKLFVLDLKKHKNDYERVFGTYGAEKLAKGTEPKFLKGEAKVALLCHVYGEVEEDFDKMEKSDQEAQYAQQCANIDILFNAYFWAVKMDVSEEDLSNLIILLYQLGSEPIGKKAIINMLNQSDLPVARKVLSVTTQTNTNMYMPPFLLTAGRMADFALALCPMDPDEPLDSDWIGTARSLSNLKPNGDGMFGLIIELNELEVELQLSQTIPFKDMIFQSHRILLHAIINKKSPYDNTSKVEGSAFDCHFGDYKGDKKEKLAAREKLRIEAKDREILKELEEKKAKEQAEEVKSGGQVASSSK